MSRHAKHFYYITMFNLSFSLPLLMLNYLDYENIYTCIVHVLLINSFYFSSKIQAGRKYNECKREV